MIKQSIFLGRIFNIPIGLDYSWFLVFALITWSLATSYFPYQFTNWPAAEYWIVGAVTAVMFFISVLLHELGHSVVALRYKIQVRSITMFIFGGVAQIASEPPSAAAEFWIALAGPVVSFALAALFTILQWVTTGFEPLLALAKYLAYINGTLALFNLIPGFPLDGGRVFRAVVWAITHSFQRATTLAATVGRVVAFGFILVGVWQMFTGNLAGGLWIAFIGWFLESAAHAQLSQQYLHNLLTGHTVAQVMSRSYAIIPGNLTLQQLADEHILIAGRRFFVVEELGRVIGLLTLSEMNKFPRQDWIHVSAVQAMIPIERLPSLQPETSLSEAFEEMERAGIGQLPVITQGEVQGILSRDNVMSFLQTLQEFARART